MTRKPNKKKLKMSTIDENLRNTMEIHSVLSGMIWTNSFLFSSIEENF